MFRSSYEAYRRRRAMAYSDDGVTTLLKAGVVGSLTSVPPNKQMQRTSAVQAKDARR